MRVMTERQRAIVERLRNKGNDPFNPMAPAYRVLAENAERVFTAESPEQYLEQRTIVMPGERGIRS